VALLGGFLVGLVAWSAVALLVREQVLVRSGLRLARARGALFGVLVVAAATWVVSPLQASPWVWPGFLVGLLCSTIVFQLARSGRLTLREPL
jgi:hypothetical protein